VPVGWSPHGTVWGGNPPGKDSGGANAWDDGRGVLRPRDTPTRERRPLNGLWRFALDAAGRGRAEQWWRAPLADALDMPVPASYNDVFASAELRNHVGNAW
jgi:hypothetical protein